MAIEGALDSRTEIKAPDLILADDGSIGGIKASQIAVFAAAITWVPLIALAAVQGLAVGPTRAESVLLDPAVYARFLVALPILIITPSKCSQTLNEVGTHFQRAGLLKGADLNKFGEIAGQWVRLRKSRVAEYICVVLAYICSAVFVLLFYREISSSWRTLGSEGHHTLSLAGWWFVAVSEPFYLFILLRFLYRTALWWQFLWKTSRLNLQLHTVHPDGAAGSGFPGPYAHCIQAPGFRYFCFVRRQCCDFGPAQWSTSDGTEVWDRGAGNYRRRLICRSLVLILSA